MMIKSLQQRLILFLLLPVAFLLISTGVIGFFYVRKIMLNQWREAAMLKLERAAHHIDMRLRGPILWIDMLQKTSDPYQSKILEEWVIAGLRGLKGVKGVHLDRLNQGPDKMGMPGSHMRQGMEMREMMRFHRARIAEVTSPVYNANAGEETISLISNLEDEKGQVIGKLRLIMSFEYILQDIRAFGWWQSDGACLIDGSGTCLTQTKAKGDSLLRLGKTGDPLELALLAEMKKKPSGTILGPGHPPDKVVGFYKLREAPWAIVLFAPGEKILAPIITFRFYYAVAGGLSMIFILLLIRVVGGKMVLSIERISKAAEQVAQGNYGDPLPVKSRDEVGQLVESFNTMVAGLKERDFISNTFGRYVDKEIARELMRRPEALKLGGEKREVAILMSDLRGFTPLSETLSPDVTIKMLNRYFYLIIETIQDHKGIIVDFFGDALLVFFDPMDGPVGPSVIRAVRCGLRMQGVMETFNSENRMAELPELQMGIGVNSGEVVVGNIGSETRAKYGIVGSAVNLTQRIQAHAKGGEVVISEPVYRYAFKQLVIKHSFEAQLKGIQEGVTLYIVEHLSHQPYEV
ncbi:MAG: adenylate/guanylate cyclase domain-containing protein [Pseudomonadota bacterium]